MPPQVVNMELLLSTEMTGTQISAIDLMSPPCAQDRYKLKPNANIKQHSSRVHRTAANYDGIHKPSLFENTRRHRRRYSNHSIASHPFEIISSLIFPGGPSAAFCNEETLSSSFLILDGFMTISLGDWAVTDSKESFGNHGNVLKGATERWGDRLETNICIGKVSYEYRLSDEDEKSLNRAPTKESDAKILSQHLDRIPLLLDQEPTDGVAGLLNPDRYIPPSQKMFADALKFQEYDQAVEVYEDILESDKERYGESDLVCAIDYHNLGVTCLLANDLDSALYYFQESVILKRACLGKNDPTVSDSLVEIGIVLYNRDNDEGALRIFKEALEIYKDSSNSDGVGRTSNNIGCVYYKMGDIESALTYLQEALIAQRMVLGVSEKAENSLLNFALTLSNIGYLKVKLGHLDAVTTLEESLLVLESVLGDENLTVASVRSAIAVAKHNPSLASLVEDVTDGLDV